MRTEQEIKDRIKTISDYIEELKEEIEIKGIRDIDIIEIESEISTLVNKLVLLDWILNEPKTNHPNKLKR